MDVFFCVNEILCAKSFLHSFFPTQRHFTSRPRRTGMWSVEPGSPARLTSTEKDPSRLKPVQIKAVPLRGWWWAASVRRWAPLLPGRTLPRWGGWCSRRWCLGLCGSRTWAAARRRARACFCDTRPRPRSGATGRAPPPPRAGTARRRARASLSGLACWCKASLCCCWASASPCPPLR